ncbi:cytochrome P450 4C1-like [Pseudomyrmex gracilis]|uniref:cytochrome P450 4C1-like n=1 Tax=Pseudomyrmex gracilis TaxID=219809 RepID=UPI000994BBAC|nr:cytochrome P450 4C1-like [Pseudomyrmex gracilis]
MIIILVLVIILLVSIYHYLYYGKKERLLNHIPGPSSLPIIGSALINVSNDKLLHRLLKLHDQYYPIMKIWFSHVPWIIIRHPDDIQAILGSTKHVEKSYIYTIFHPWLQTGLFTSKGSKWHTRRKILTPAFHFTILKQFIDIFIEESNRMVATLKNAKEPVVKELLSFMSNHTLNIICESAMGISLENSTKLEHYHNALYQIGEVIVYRFLRPWLYNEWIIALLPIGRKQRKLVRTLQNFTEKIIAERKQYHKRTDGRYLKNIENDTYTEVDDTEIIGTKKRRLAMLDLLIAMSQENNLTDSDIREEVDIFTFAGHDTTALTATFALMLLAEHKDIQDRVRLEVNTILKENNDKFTMSSLQNLSYLERCIKETLRLYPTVPSIARVTTEDVKLQSYIVPAGTDIGIYIYSVHRDPNFWPNPEIFDPDRFLQERSKNRHPYSYIPFSAGPRNCIGQRYGLLELKVIIATLIHNFYLEPVDYLKDVKLGYSTVLRPDQPVYIKFVPIESL